MAADHHSTTPRSPITFDDEQGASLSQPPRWAVFAGLALIALQLLTFDVVLERHARHAQARASHYVTVTLQPRPDAPMDAGAPALLVAGN